MSLLSSICNLNLFNIFENMSYSNLALMKCYKENRGVGLMSTFQSSRACFDIGNLYLKK